MVDCLFYTIVAGAGYLSFFNTVNPIIIVNYSIDGVDYWMVVGALAICLIMVASLPVNYHPWRFQTFSFCCKRKEFSQKENFGITGLFMAGATLIAIVFPDITSVISIMGGLCSCTMSYLIPVVAYVRLNNEPWHAMKNLLPIIFFGTLTLIGYTSVLITLYLLSTGKQWVGTRHDLEPIVF